MVRIEFFGIDDGNRPVFKDPSSGFYGSLDKLFPHDATEKEVLDRVTEADLVFFGHSFNCEPMGVPSGSVKIDGDWKEVVTKEDLKRWRKRYNLTREHIGQLVGRTGTAWGAWERGDRAFPSTLPAKLKWLVETGRVK